MAKTRHNLELRIFEQPHRNPTTIEEAEENRELKEIVLKPADRVIRGRNVDTCLRTARKYAEETLGRIVRTCNIGPDGISIIVYSESEKVSPGSWSEKALLKGLVNHGD
jgi:hypothetical protein